MALGLGLVLLIRVVSLRFDFEFHDCERYVVRVMVQTGGVS